MSAALAAVLVVVGLVLAPTAPALPSANNKVDAYGGPVPEKPTNPRPGGRATSTTRPPQAGGAQGRRATAAYTSKKACAKKSGAKKAACLKAAKRKFTAAKAKVAKQAKAEKACQDALHEVRERDRGADLGARRHHAPDYDAQRSALEAQETAAGTTQQACMKKAQSS